MVWGAQGPASATPWSKVQKSKRDTKNEAERKNGDLHRAGGVGNIQLQPLSIPWSPSVLTMDMDRLGYRAGLR